MITDECKNNCELVNTFYRLERRQDATIATLTDRIKAAEEAIAEYYENALYPESKMHCTDKLKAYVEAYPEEVE